MRLHIFDLGRFIGMPIKIRVVDDVPPGGPTDRYYINVDEFRFLAAPPAGVKWWTWIDLTTRGVRCGGLPGVGDGCSPIGEVLSEPPLWGITDIHSHPMANLAYGGHVIWGDVTDPLWKIYDCSHKLDAIPGPGGRGNSRGSGRQRLLSRRRRGSHRDGNRVCSLHAAQFHSFRWRGVSALCKTIGSSVLHTPLVYGASFHGAIKFPSGAVKIGGLLEDSWIAWFKLLGQEVGDIKLFIQGLIESTDSWPDLRQSHPELDWYPDDKNVHSLHGLGRTHNHYQADMVRRAFNGGLRLGVWDVTNSRAFAFVADGTINASDWQALKDQTDAAKRIVQAKLSDIAQIAGSASDADWIIRSGKMAVILGTEVAELGRMRPDRLPWPRSPHSPGDSMQKQIDDLWELGIRKVTPTHVANNPIGGAAIFTKDYVANNHFLSSTPLEGDYETSFREHLAVRFVMDRQIGTIPIRFALGMFAVQQSLGGDGKTPWNPQGWFELEVNPQGQDRFIGDGDALVKTILPPMIGSLSDWTMRQGGFPRKSARRSGSTHCALERSGHLRQAGRQM